MPKAAAAQPLPPRLLQETAAMFALLSAAVRLHVLWLLGEQEQDVSTLAEATGQTIATVSHHLAKLKLAGIVTARRHGKRMVYVVQDPNVIDVVRMGIERRLALERKEPQRRVRRA